MKNDVDLARLTAEWLQQGSRPLPTRVLDGTMSAVSRTRQLSAAHPLWTVRLARAVALGAAAAAVVMVVAYGPLVADRVGGLPHSRPQALQVRREPAVEVAREQQARGGEVLAPLRCALEDDVVDDDPAGEVRSGHASERAGVAAVERVEVPGERVEMAAQHRRHHRQRGGLPEAVAPRVPHRDDQPSVVAVTIVEQ